MSRIDLEACAQLMHSMVSIEAVTPIAMICGLLIATPLSDKYGRKPVTLIGMTISSAFCIAFGFARNDWQLIALRALIGLFNSAQAA